MQHSSSTSPITLRNLPPKLARRIREKARQDGTSLNKTVIRMLEEGLGLRERSAGRRVYDDLRDLSGKWSKEEAAEFNGHLRDMRQLDADMWD